MNNRYYQLNKNLIPYKLGCYIPFVVLGDPSIEISLEIIYSLIKNGADGLELGIPFSDPLADGPIIQQANLRAFSANITLTKCFEMLFKIRTHNPKIPIGILIYANLIFKLGIQKFYSICSKIDIDSVLIADVPIEESFEFEQHSIKNNIDSIFVCPPDASKNFLKKLSKHSTGYIYLLSRSGVTGIDMKITPPLKNFVKELKKLTSIPIIQGFGISNENQIKNIILSGVSGVICGSVIIQIIANNLNNKKIMLKKIKKLSNRFKKATII
ncbi:tryptophan synthase alpha chain [Buchnera aphidicola str. Bp (Baizongia pistaciae)]|uniref:Tryptophan synthase alpha chain n=1 Tax=Buchnera aphidicola subsp. Baizongia pistaciae (strain Bp) TaxID=224915 RepID=TRPA_BUCBP|nr:tryptophan synthase subunit alpha [Buchnera aphidicola]P59457.1 RecName: Full=Tryptophan synthase alpha chain [Buchnera aphidicola str. Bp (Baizongia pistaciae)]AAO26984.1 tryptophan synthase alpha chain [Buchnera aphidicola str. Bp (Baizongia pistaciae)]